MSPPTRSRPSGQKTGHRAMNTLPTRQDEPIDVDAEVAAQRSPEQTTVQDAVIYTDHTLVSGSPTRGVREMSSHSSSTAPIEGEESNVSIKQEAVARMQTQEMEAIIRRPKELLLALNRLSELGLQNLEIPLPNIVVLGDQSAGKSSVIEAISEITVPRSSGTCTRCPLLIKSLADDEPGAAWKCKVELLKHYDFYGKSFPRSLEDESPFKPWIANATPVVIPFMTVDNEDALRDAIHRAQLALLNPGQRPEKYASGPVLAIGDSQGLQCEFSPNVVSIEISGPGRINLSFYDLPGIINQTEDDSKPYLVEIVRNLAKEYIKSEDAIVLLAKSMEADPHNSSAAKLAKDMRATERCVGVLTKPDRLPRGDSVDIWRRMLSGDAFHLPLGYYVTKQPSQTDLNRGVDHRRARQMENVFFQSCEPWATKFSEFKDRFGTAALQKALSDELAGRMVKNLPQIHDKIRAQIEEVDEELRTIPEPPKENAQGMIFETLQTFADRIQKEMDGELPYNKWRVEWQKLRQSFSQYLESMRPMIIPKGVLDQGLYRVDKTIDLTEDTDDDSESAQALSTTPNKRHKVEEQATPRRNPVQELSSPRRKAPGTKKDDLPFANLAMRFHLDFIRREIAEKSTSDIPGEVDSKALDHLMLLCFQEWHKPMQKFFTDLEKALKRQVSQIFRDVLGHWETTDFYRRSKEIVEQFMRIHLGQQRDGIATRALRLARGKPYIGEIDRWDEMVSKNVRELEEMRKSRRLGVYIQEKKDSLGKDKNKDLTKAEIDAAKKEGKEVIENDPYHREVEVMAKCRSYYKMSLHEFHNQICRSLQQEFFEALRSSLQDELKGELGVTGPDSQDRCIQLLAENPDRERRRQGLTKKREALLQGQKVLEDLNQQYRGVARIHPGSSSNGTDYQSTLEAGEMDLA